MTPRKKNPIVCDCLGVTEHEVLEAVRKRKLRTVNDIARYTQAGEGCTACHPLLREILKGCRRDAA